MTYEYDMIHKSCIILNFKKYQENSIHHPSFHDCIQIKRIKSNLKPITKTQSNLKPITKTK